jgi:protease IV
MNDTPPATGAPPLAPLSPDRWPPPPPRRRGRLFLGCCLGTVGTLGLIGAGILGLVWIVATLIGDDATALPAFGRNSKVHEELIGGQEKAKDKIAVIEIKGVIVSARLYDGASATDLCEALRAAAADPAVRAVLLDIDTPGGEITASDEIHQAVKGVRQAGKPVVSCMRSMGASGGYYIATASDWIVANRLTLTGSVGVIVSGWNVTGLLDKVGVRATTYKSGAMKDMLSPMRNATPQEEAYLNGLVRQDFLEFAAVVAQGRTKRYPTVEAVLNAPFSDGRVLSGRDAFAAGLVDELGYFDDAARKALQLAGVHEARLMRFKRATGLGELLFSMRANGRATAVLPLPAAWTQIPPGVPCYLLPTAAP